MRDIILYNFIVYLIHDIVKDERYHLIRSNNNKFSNFASGQRFVFFFFF